MEATELSEDERRILLHLRTVKNADYLNLPDDIGVPKVAYELAMHHLSKRGAYHIIDHEELIGLTAHGKKLADAVWSETDEARRLEKKRNDDQL